MIKGGKSATHTHPGSGLLICLKRVPNLTKRGLLRDPYFFQNGPLSEFGWDTGVAFNDYEVLRAGQFTGNRGRPQLRTVSFESLVVDYNPPWAVYVGGNRHRGYDEDGRAPIPSQVSDELDSIARAGTPLRLIVWNKGLEPRAELNWIVTFRSFTPRERGGEPDARYFTFSFTEFRRTKLRRRGYTGTTRGHDLPTAVRVTKDGIAREYDYRNVATRNGGTVAPEEIKWGHKIGTESDPATLRKLALHFYGNSVRWREIAAYNGVTALGPDDPLTKLDRRGRKARTLRIPPVTWEPQTGLAQAKKVPGG